MVLMGEIEDMGALVGMMWWMNLNFILLIGIHGLSPLGGRIGDLAFDERNGYGILEWRQIFSWWVIATCMGSNMGSWCTAFVRGAYGVSLWKYISKG